MSPELREEILEQVKLDVQIGFEQEEELFESIVEIFCDEESLDASWLRTEISKRLSHHLKQAESWQRPTDFERLSNVFDQLNLEGIVSLHKAGFTRQDAEGDCTEIMDKLRSLRINVKGYCYYHAQDVERLIDGQEGLMLGYDGFEQNDDLAMHVARRIVEELRKNQFDVKWSGSLDSRIEIVSFDWKKTPNSDASYSRSFELLQSSGAKGKVGKKPFWKFW